MNLNSFDPEKGYQQYMNLLVAQIQYQDPLEPVAQEDVTAQLAQISTVSGINELNLKFGEMLQMQTMFDGARMVGNHVEYTSPDDGEIRQGQIMEARARDGVLEFHVNEEKIGIGDIRAVISSETRFHSSVDGIVSSPVLSNPNGN